MVEPSDNLQRAFDVAQEEAKSRQHEYVTLEHLLFSMLQDEEFENLLKGHFETVLKSSASSANLIKAELETYLDTKLDDIKTTATKYKPKKTTSIERVTSKAFAQVLFSGRNNIEIFDVFVGLYGEKKSYAYYLIQKAGIKKDEFITYLGSQNIVDNVTVANSYDPASVEHPGYSSSSGSAMSKKAIKAFTTNLNQEVIDGKIDPVIGREEEIEQVALALGRRSKSNVIMVGDPGVGKTAIAEGLAYKIVNKEVPEFLQDYTVFNLDIGAMLAGSRYRGDFEERFKLVIEALQNHGKAVMFIDEAHMISGAGAGKDSSNDLANMLKPALSKGNIKVIASTTWEEYRKFFEKDRALMRRFQRVSVDEPSPEMTVEILKGIKKYYETFHEVEISDSAIEAAVKLSVKYQRDKKLPDKAIDLIDVACSRFKVRDQKDNKIVTEENVQYELAKMIKLPEEQVKEKETENLANLERSLKSTVFGQDEAIESVVDKILVAQAGLKSENKPIGSFVFMGPTGTGKTETAKQLASHLGVKLVRFDMSEYMEKHSVAKLIGSPPGYVGFEDNAGQLIVKLQENPNCVLLLDEIEKAHPDVSQLLLQLMDNGKVTGSNGKEADARNCILILTTNLGAKDAEKNSIGFGDTLSKEYDDGELKKFFSPEFRNRLDGIVKFSKLEKTVMLKIVGKFLKDLKDLVKEKNIDIVASDEAFDYLVDKGFDPKMGARPLQRVIDNEIKKPLSRMMLFGELKNGGLLKINVVNNEIKLKAIVNALDNA